MAATVQIGRKTGASGSIVFTQIDGLNARANAEDAADTGTPTTNPIRIPSAGTNYSFWVTTRLKVTVTPAGTIDNLRWFTDGANNFGTGVTCKGAKASTGADAGYRQATGTAGTTGTQLTQANHSGLDEAPADVFGFTSGPTGGTGLTNLAYEVTDSTTLGSDASIWCWSADKASAGAIGTVTCTESSLGPDQWVAVTGALKPAPVQTDKTHTTDSLLKGTPSKTHTTDSLLKSTFEKTHSTDSLLKATPDKAHTTDSSLKGQLDKTHTTDSLLQTTTQTFHSTDSLLKATVEKTHSTDSFLKATQEKTHSTDSLLRAVSDKSHTTDSFLASPLAGISHTTDSLLKATGEAAHQTDSLLKAAQEKAHTSDSLLKGTPDSSHTTDSLLKGTIDESHTADSLLKASPEESHSTDSLLKAAADRAHTTDSLLKAGQAKTHSTDSLLKGTSETNHATDSLLRATAERTHRTDSLLKGTGQNAHTTDSLLHGTREASHTTDSYIVGRVEKTHTTDSLLKGASSKAHTTDSYLVPARGKFVEVAVIVDQVLKAGAATPFTVAVFDWFLFEDADDVPPCTVYKRTSVGPLAIHDMPSLSKRPGATGLYDGTFTPSAIAVGGDPETYLIAVDVSVTGPDAVDTRRWSQDTMAIGPCAP